MSDSPSAGFGQFVPGFDFLQNLAKGASQTIPQMPGLANWVTPSLNLEELEKRIADLKAVHFWLEQNARALAATIQALEVQKMTLATLKGMNFSLGEVANAFAPKPAEPTKLAGGGSAMVDTMQLWGSLTQQFQQIAAGALQDAGKTAAAVTATTNATTTAAAASLEATTPPPAAKKTARKTAVRAR